MKTKVLTVAFVIVATVVVYLVRNNNGSLFGPGEMGEIITPVQLEQMKKETSSDGKRLAVVGRISISNRDLTIQIGHPVSLNMMDEDGNRIDYFDFYYGESGKNKFHIPSQFSPEDLTIFDNDGNQHPYDQLIQVSFTMERIKDAMPEQDPATGNYVWRYENIRIDPVQ